MTPLTVSKQTPLSEVIALMGHHRQTCRLTCTVASSTPEATTLHDCAPKQSSLASSCVIVVEDSKPIGIFTERDLVRLAATENTVANRTIETVMTSPLITVSEQKAHDLFAVLSLLQQHHIRHIPIVDDDGKLVGISTRESIRQLLQPADLLRLRHAAETMTRNVIQAEPTATLRSIAQLMAQHQISCVVITETIEGKTCPLGIVTEGDIVQFQALQLDLARLTAQGVMSSPVFCASPELSLWQTHQLMLKHRITHLVITHGDGSLAGILTQTTILKALNPAEMIEVISSLQQQVKCLKNEKLQLLESRNTELQQAINNELVTRQQTEMRLRESEKRYSSLIAVLPVVIFRADTFGACTYINKHWTKLTGISYQETLGQGWVQGIYSEDQDQVVSSWQQMLQLGKPWQQEFRLQLPDGSIKWVYGQAQPDWGDTGKISSYVGSLTDISDRKQTELALYESEQRFRRAIANAPVPIMIHAEDGEVLQISSTWTELTGYTHADIPTTQAWIERAYPEQMTSIVTTKILQQYGLTSRLEEEEVTITTHDGQYRVWNFSSASLGALPDGRRMAITMAADISEKYQAKIALQVSETRYRALVEVIPDLLIRQDAEGNYLDLVMSNEIRFVQPDLAYRGVNIYDLLPLDLAQQRMAYVRQALATGKVQLYDFEINTGSELRWQEARIIAINQTEVLVIVRDISKRKRAEQKRQQAEISLRQIVEGTAAVTEHDFFQELVQHITAALDIRYASISEAQSDGFSILAFCADGQLQTVDHCPYEQFPCCTQALQQGQCYHPDSLPKLYPENELFNSLNAESYLGIGLRNSKGGLIGNLCIMHDRPLKNPEWMISLLKIFGARAGAELERYQMARQLQVLTNQLEQRVVERTATLAKTVEHLKTEIQRRQALENLLLQSQEQLQDIFDNVNDMIQSVSLNDGSFEFVNRAWLDTLGYTAQDLERLTIFDVLHPDCQEHCRKLIRRLQMGHLQCLDQVEISFVTQDGRTIHVEGNVNCRIIDGRPVYTRGVFRDISDRKKAEAEMAKALERERELNQMKSRFVSNTSHEFRTPLTVISNNAELLKLFGDKLDTTEKQKCLDTILNYVDHMTELINDVLIVSKAESGKIMLKPQPLNVVELSQQLIQTIGRSAPKHHLEFVLRDARRPSQNHLSMAQLDNKILHQSLTNLLTNAIKYSAEGSTITFDLELLPNAVQFRVIDEGIGIPEEDQKYLFEPFHRADNVDTIPGTGLGLSIVKRLIILHQGSINVDSAPGKGSCFTVKIPTQWQEVEP